jgi:hypothetical protein
MKALGTDSTSQTLSAPTHPAVHLHTSSYPLPDAYLFNDGNLATRGLHRDLGGGWLTFSVANAFLVGE